MEAKVERCGNGCKGNGRLPREPFDCQLIGEKDAAIPASDKQDYLNERNVLQLFHFLLSHTIVHRPTNPVRYLRELIDDLLLFGSGLKGPRLYWSERHVQAIFKNVASRDSELLSLNDYKAAMKIFGTSSYDPCPTQFVPGYIDLHTFCMEALNNTKREVMRIVNHTTATGRASNASFASFLPFVHSDAMRYDKY